MRSTNRALLAVALSLLAPLAWAQAAPGGQATLPLLLRHIDVPKDRITIVTAEGDGDGHGRAILRIGAATRDRAAGGPVGRVR